MLEDTLTNISDTLDDVSQQFEGEPVQSTTLELTDQQMAKRKILRVVIALVIIGLITALLVRRKK
jgi:hypothetical protein